MAIARIGVIGAGAAGRGIAALAASAGLPVVLLDLPGQGGSDLKARTALARTGLQQAVESKPSAFLDPARASLVTVGNTADHLGLLSDCDWICEAIVEQLGPKRALLARLESVTKSAIITSNTSGIPMWKLADGRSAAFRNRFCGAHFFHPARSKHLVELIPGPGTSPETLATLTHLHQRLLGKGVVVAKDVPGFIANRLSVAGLVAAVRLMMEFDLDIDEVDSLTGPLIARSESGTFRSADLAGLHVLVDLAGELARATGEDLAVPSWVEELAGQARGGPCGAGFYQRVGHELRTFDWRTFKYRPRKRYATSRIVDLMRLPAAARLRRARALRGRQGEFLRRLLTDSAHYWATTTPFLAHDIAAIDRAMEWGCGWTAGPFKAMDALGLAWLRAQFAAAGKADAPMLATVGRSFYRSTRRGVTVAALPNHGIARRSPLPVPAGCISLPELQRAGRVLERNDEARCVDLGDGVLCVEFCRSNLTLGHDAVEMLLRGCRLVHAGRHAGLVIGHEDPHVFSPGIPLSELDAAVKAASWTDLDRRMHEFQQAMLALRLAPFPVVVAPFGIAHGRGCEIALHGDRVQAHAELDMGLTDTVLGMVPSGGGTKELLFRFTAGLQPYADADPFEAARRAFDLIAPARTSSSAFEARRLGLLWPAADRISMNRDFLLGDAKARVLDLAVDYVAPALRSVRTLGRETFGNLKALLWSEREAGRASAHDVLVGEQVAFVLAGGDGPPRDVTEQDILDLERDATLRLLGTAATQARIRHVVDTGRPLRN